ncbi:hypothetical protein [Brevibacillus sp. NRS-1366]|uniref:hypothetical protein n=1 Tax=Brevibacillus sp. NRS-1366 TaxID=3233899 RepID=UPI003D24BE73
MLDKDYYVRRIELAQADIEAITESNFHNAHLLIDCLNSKIINWKSAVGELTFQ